MINSNAKVITLTRNLVLSSPMTLALPTANVAFLTLHHFNDDLCEICCHLWIVLLTQLRNIEHKIPTSNLIIS